MRRVLVILCSWVLVCTGRAQTLSQESSTPLVLSDAVGLALAKAQVLENAADAWQYTFGQEPGGRILTTDPDQYLIEGSARVNFRSATLLNREETQGSVSYKVRITAENGQCVVRISDVRHTGNHAAHGGGMDLGTIVTGTGPLEKPAGMSWLMAHRIHEEIRGKATERIQQVLRAFLSRMRQSGGQ